MIDKVFKTLGASNHSNNEREENDYYATDPKAVEWLLKLETFNPNIWECACGEGHISDALKSAGYTVLSTDIVDRGYGDFVVDFLTQEDTFDGDIITNPPYKYATEFVEKALELIPEGNKVAMLLKIQFLEGKSRRKLFDKAPPKTIYVSSSRICCAKNGDFSEYQRKNNGAMAYIWCIWEKGFRGDPIVRWFN